MARHMVGGKLMLFIGIIALDAGMLSLSLQDSPREFMIFYLLGTFAFSGLVDVLRARESRRVGARSWRLTLIIGAINLALAIFAGVFGFVLKKQILYLISTAKASSTAGSCVSFLHFARPRSFISSRYEKTLAGLCSSMYNKQEKQRRFERKRVSLRAPFCAIRPESGCRACTSSHSTANGHRSGSAARCAYRAG